MKRDEKKLGETVANDFMNSLIDYLIQIETLSITNASKEILNQNFKTPNELVELAFKLSFEDSNYNNVYKYVIDVNRYCKEVCFENIKNDLEILTLKKKEEIKNLYCDLLKFFLNCNLPTKISSCKVYFEILEEEAKEKNESLARLFNEKDSIIGTEINDFELFINGFKQSIGKFDKELNDKLKKFNNELDKRSKSEIIDYIDNYIGCNSRCPCCGSKCQNAKGHQGNHRSQFHILNGFFKWSHIDTKEIFTNFCWEEGLFIESKFYIGDKEYENCTKFLENEHPEWLFDIKENYDEYGKNPSNSGNIKFRSQIMRAWMNTRKPLLREYLKEYKIVDKKYNNKWLSLEDAENMLPENHVQKWNENI